MRYNPKYQGRHDSLCSVYSIINAYGLVMSSTEDEQQKLFDDIILYLHHKKILKDVIIGGVFHKHMLMMMNDVVGDRIVSKELIWRSFPTPTRRTFWNSIKDHLQNKHTAVILSLGGRADHLTVVCHATDRTLKLLDSDGISSIRYSNCTIDTNRNEKKYILYPSQSWFLSKE